MNTLEIKHALERNPVTEKTFCGVFPADEIPKSRTKFPCGFVVNTDPSTEPGTHWVAFYFPFIGKGEFFDSYGKPPEHYGFHVKVNTYNTRRLQSSWTEVCGQYCIFFLYHRSNGKRMNEIVTKFTDNTERNDCEVACYVKKRFNVVIENQPLCGLIQCCKKLNTQK